MSLFKKTKPFVSYRVYMNVDEEDTESVTEYGFKWDDEYKTWYLDGYEYINSNIAKDERIKMKFSPFKVYGHHQYFI